MIQQKTAKTPLPEPADQEKSKMPEGSRRHLKKWRLRGNIRVQLLFAFALMVLLTTVAISAFTSVRGFLNGQDQVVNQLEALAVLKENEINSWAQNLQTDLSVLSAQEPLLELMRDILNPEIASTAASIELRANLFRMLGLTLRLEEIFLVDEDGQVVVSTDRNQEGKIFNTEDFFQQGLTGPTIVPPRYSPALDATSVIVARPIFQSEGDVAGVLVGRADLERLNEIMVERSGFGDTGESYLIGLNHSLITDSRFPGYAPRETFIRNEGANAALSNQTNGFGLYQNYRDKPVVGVYRWLPDLELALLAEQEQAEAFRPVYTTLLVNIAIAVGAVLLAIVVAVFVTRNITLPLTELSETATQITGGNLAVRAKEDRYDEIGELAHSLNQMADTSQELIQTLETRVQERTQALETASEISREILNITNVDDLLKYVIDHLHMEFNFYHTHVYLIDETTDDLVLAYGYGEIGKQLKAQGHHLKKGMGIVGIVADTNEYFLSNNVNTAYNFVPNPLLPETNSELALPLRKGRKVLGVLDIQSEKADRFSPEDVNLMQSVANQIAITLENIKTLEAAQATAAEAEELNRRLTRQGWQALSAKIGANSYLYNNEGISPTDRWLPVMGEAVKQKNLVRSAVNSATKKSPDDVSPESVAVPLMLRGEIIGVIGIKRSENSPWSDDELFTVRAISEQVALALDAARLARETERAAWRDRLVSESTAQVWSSAELEEVMKTAVTQLGSKLRASEVVLRLGSKTQSLITEEER